VIELRREPPDGPAALALWDEYMALVRERLGDAFQPTEDIFATASDFDGPGAAWIVLYEDGEPVGCGGLRALEPHTGEIKRMFVTAGARRRGHGRRLLGELEAIAAAAGQRRIRLYTTTVLVEARALYETAGYALASTHPHGARTDYWLEKTLQGASV
jgi:GNAT superfamily N-acetyltransferase